MSPFPKNKAPKSKASLQMPVNLHLPKDMRA